MIVIVIKVVIVIKIVTVIKIVIVINNQCCSTVDKSISPPPPQADIEGHMDADCPSHTS